MTGSEVRPAGPPGAGRHVAADPSAEATHRAARWGALVVLGGVAGGLPGAVTALLLAGWQLLARPVPTRLLGLAAALLALVPVAWVIGNAGRLGEVTPDLVRGNPWPGALATAGAFLLVVGVLRDTRPSPAPSIDGDPS